MTAERFEPDSGPTPGSASRRRSTARRILGSLGWLLGGAILAIVLVADPLALHPIDTWLHGVVAHGDHGTEARGDSRDANLWTCGMHPEVILEEPGPCPICGMDLVPLASQEDSGEAVSTAETSAADAPRQWTCERHPQILEEQPGECPIDGRPLVPVEPQAEPSPGEAPESAEREVLYYRHPHDPGVVSDVPAKDAMGMDFIPVYADEAPGIEGATVTIDPTVVQNMNVVTAPVEVRDLSREIRTVGYLDYDQQKMVSVTTKYGGFIEKVYVNYLGEPVRPGQPLFEVYSPELVQTQAELLSALSFARRLATAPPEARQRAEALVEAARRRLGFWDIGEEQIRSLEESGEANRTLTVRSPARGVVMMRMPGLEGMAVRPGMELFHIADLSTLWLSVEIFEDQLPWLEIGSDAEISLSYFPGEVFRGRVRFVEPQLEEKTRTVGLRIELPNPRGRLLAGMYATVRFEPVAARDAIAVPSLALIRTGERNLVIVAEGGGRFTPREVVVGVQGHRYVQILAGLAPGERVVTSAQFLLDSESNLREAIQKLIDARRTAAGAGPASPPVADPEPAHPDADHAGH